MFKDPNICIFNIYDNYSMYYSILYNLQVFPASRLELSARAGKPANCVIASKVSFCMSCLDYLDYLDYLNYLDYCQLCDRLKGEFLSELLFEVKILVII